jgi:hypothetical protein
MACPEEKCRLCSKLDSQAAQQRQRVFFAQYAELEVDEVLIRAADEVLKAR